MKTQARRKNLVRAYMSCWHLDREAVEELGSSILLAVRRVTILMGILIGTILAGGGSENMVFSQGTDADEAQRMFDQAYKECIEEGGAEDLCKIIATEALRENDDAKVDGGITVEEDLKVRGNIEGRGDVEIRGNIIVRGNSAIRGNSKINGDEEVDGDSTVGGHLIVNGIARIDDICSDSGTTEFCGSILVQENAHIGGNLEVVGTITGTPNFTGLVYADQSCTAGQVVTGIASDGTVLCVPDADTRDFAHRDQSCTAGQVVTGIASDGTVLCVPDADTRDFAHRDQSCAAGQVVTGIASDGTVLCVPDADTRDFAHRDQSCTAGQVVTGIASDGTVLCVPDADTRDFAHRDQSCAAGQVVTGIANDGTVLCVPTTEPAIGDKLIVGSLPSTVILIDSDTNSISVESNPASEPFTISGGTIRLSGKVNVDGPLSLSRQSPSLPAADTLDLPDGGNIFRIAGSAMISEISAMDRGTIVILRFIVGQGLLRDCLSEENCDLSRNLQLSGPFYYEKDTNLTSSVMECSGMRYHDHNPACIRGLVL